MTASDRNTERILAGPLGRELARFGTPLAIGMGLQTAFNLVDMYLIGQLQPEVRGAAIGAIGICDQLAALGTIISYGLSVATSAMISRRQGQGDLEGVRRVAWQSLLVVLLLSAGFGLVGGAGARVLMVDIVGAKGQVAELGTQYLRVLMGGSFTIFLLLHLTTLMRALGSSKTPVTLLVVANVLNLVLAVLLIFGPGPAPPVFSWGPPLAAALGLPRLELLGAAWATLLARLVVLLPLVVLLVRRFDLFGKNGRERPRAEVMRAIVRLGWPSSAQLVMRIAAMLLTHSLVARAFTTEQDQTASTALGIVFRLETMALFVGLGWGSAAQTFVGQNLGAGNIERAKLSGYYAAVFNGVMMAALAAIYGAFGRELVAFFDEEERVIDIALGYFRWVGPTYVGLGVGIVLGAAMQGAGATLQALLLDAAVVFFFQIPASLFVGFASGVSYQHIWLVVGTTYVAFGLIYFLAYRRGRFLRAVAV
ncbi:MAG TPA: MATE family efflux transporter [Polyangiaceae bacterium]|nr:MATE family efflux transporter [Polyangiaceae bacterium]